MALKILCYQQWIIVQVVMDLRLHKQMTRGLIPDYCVEKQFGWNKITHLMCSSGFPTNINHG